MFKWSMYYKNIFDCIDTSDKSFHSLDITKIEYIKKNI